MKKRCIRQSILVAGLIAAACAAMAWSDQPGPIIPDPGPGPVNSAKSGIVTLSGRLTQDRIYTGGDGRVSLVLNLQADDVAIEAISGRHADMVIVLDRSGSMSGQKLDDAKRAVFNLLADLSPADRFALVAYSGQARVVSGLAAVTPQARSSIAEAVSGIRAAGGTNLGRGLEEGLRLLTTAEKSGNLGRIILISDGLANQGITAPEALGSMASNAPEHHLSVTTVGVGYDFNEQLMTLIADRGAGTYYFLENPEAFASVFRAEFHRTRTVAASGVKVRVPETGGVRLADAGGYPVTRESGRAVIIPGDLLSGETRKLYLTFQIPTGREADFKISGIDLQYRYRNETYAVVLKKSFAVACINDPDAALASVNGAAWADKVLTEDFNRLREEVAGEIKAGKPAAAKARIDRYYSTQQTINARVQSEAVAKNLKEDLDTLRSTVTETFTGNAAEVREKQKANAKAVQYEGYSGRRMKQ